MDLRDDGRRVPWVRVDLLALLGLVVLGTVPFHIWPIDLVVSGWFYDPARKGMRWLAEAYPLIDAPGILFHVVTGIAAAGAAVVLWRGIRRRDLKLRIAGGFVLTSLLLGPWFLVHEVVKDRVGRSRPRKVDVFQGEIPYQAPFVLGPAGAGKSLPSGHAAYGFGLVALWFLWRRRRPGLARAALATAVIGGLVLGFGRIAQGAHFLSDVLWAAILPFATCAFLDHAVFRLERREVSGGPLPPRPAWVRGGFAAAGAALVLLVLFANPYHHVAQVGVRPSQVGAGGVSVEFTADRADVEVLVVDPCEWAVSVETETAGSGFPNGRLTDATERREGEPASLVHTIRHDGWFAKVDTDARIRIVEGRVPKLTVRVGDGSIRVSSVRPGMALPELVLDAGSGPVNAPAGAAVLLPGPAR